jgi:DNA invertase Pin-like site-specific DNA recombinase
MLVGYMRVSTADERQSVDLQRDALLATGVDERHLHEDRASGARDDRPGLKACLADLKPSQSQTCGLLATFDDAGRIAISEA